MTEQVKHLMTTLNLTEAEALQMIADDAEIDHGADLFPLTPEQEKASKKARSTGARVYTFAKRERKPDPDKREMIDALNSFLIDFIHRTSAEDDVFITNPERQIDFTYNGRAFRIVLSAPRPQKDPPA